jgi:hypothetical protein
MRRKVWDAQEMAKLKELWDSDLSTKQIAAIFRSSHRGIEIKAHRMGLARRTGKGHRATPERVAIAQNLHAHGVAFSHIAQRLGVCHQTVVNWVRNPPQSVVKQEEMAASDKIEA